MRIGRLQSKRKIVDPERRFSPFLPIALLLGLCLHMVGFLLFRVSSNSLPTREPSAPFVRYVSLETLLSGAELEEQAALLDSAPLFVPGRWNAAHNLQAPMRDRALLRFPAYRPATDFRSALLPDGLSDGQNYEVAEPADLLALRYWDLFRSFAAAQAPAEFTATGVFAELRSLDGAVLRTLPVEIDLLSMQAIQPATYYLRVESDGRVVGRPTLSISSGHTAFDAAAYIWLTESGFSAGLPAGFLQVSIYP